MLFFDQDESLCKWEGIFSLALRIGYGMPKYSLVSLSGGSRGEISS